MNTITYDIRKLERTLEEYGVDYDTRVAIVEASISHNKDQLLKKFEKMLQKNTSGISQDVSVITIVTWGDFREIALAPGGYDVILAAAILHHLRKVGFEHVELLHKNSCFAAFGGIKAS